MFSVDRYAANVEMAFLRSELPNSFQGPLTDGPTLLRRRGQT